MRSHGGVFVTSAKFFSSNPGLRSCASLIPAHGVLEIHDGEDL